MKQYIRDAIFDEINRLAEKDDDIILMTADASAFGLKEFQKNHPTRFFNVGIAEQAMLTVAAGMALAGKKVFVYAIAPFVTLRCLEQIKVNICAMDLPVFILGLGIGYAYGIDGPSHSSVFDVGVMASMPNMSVYNPIDYNSAVYCTEEAVRKKKPAYIRIDKDAFEDLYAKDYDFTNGYGVLQNNSKDIVTISTGICTHYALEGRKYDKIIDFFNLNHFNKEKLIGEIKGYKKLNIYEEQWTEAGLGSIISNFLVDEGISCIVKKIGLNESQCYEQSFGTREWLHKRYGIDKKSIERM